MNARQRRLVDRQIIKRYLDAVAADDKQAEKFALNEYRFRHSYTLNDARRKLESIRLVKS